MHSQHKIDGEFMVLSGTFGNGHQLGIQQGIVHCLKQMILVLQKVQIGSRKVAPSYVRHSIVTGMILNFIWSENCQFYRQFGRKIEYHVKIS